MAVCDTSIWYTGTSTTSSVHNDTVWREWITTDCTYSTSTVWRTWTNTTSTSTTDTWYAWQNGEVRRVAIEPPRQTEEELRAERERMEAHQEKMRLQREKEEKERKEAEARARELLLDNLTPAQRLDLEEFGFFFVKSKRPDRKYRLRKGRVGNVDVMENGQIIHRLCAHPSEYVPDDDTRLSQMLMLMHQEDRFIGLANVHPARH